jgi:xylulose-5-phosphate/fructose-6-phosphate phosphoketolase
MIGSKQPTPVYLSAEDAMEHCKRGVSIWKFASTHDGEDPDVVLVGIGVEVTFEVIKAAELLAKLVPKLRVRVINVTDLLVLPQESHHSHALSPKEFEELFTVDKPVCFNYHSYATELQGLLFGRPALHRITVEGYKEEGSTTTPFDMMLLNGVSRFHVASRALNALAPCNDAIQGKLSGLLSTIDEEMTRVQDYIREFGKGDLNLNRCSEDTYANPLYRSG